MELFRKFAGYNLCANYMKPPGFGNCDNTLEEDLRHRILVLDGAMGTVIRQLKLKVEDFPGRPSLLAKDGLPGCCDFVCLARPDIIRRIHRAYIEAGADIISTNTFNANAVSLAHCRDMSLVREINLAGAGLACNAAETALHETGRHVYVAGSMGPTSILLSRAAPQRCGDVAEVFETVAEAYRCQAEALIEGGVDLLLVETIVDSRNAQAAITGMRRAFGNAGRSVPFMLSLSPDESGRLLSGEKIEEFTDLVQDAGAFCIGLNCGFGIGHLGPCLDKLGTLRCHVSVHPNAGMPDNLGLYPHTPGMMASAMAGYMRQGKLNIAGGCCGTTPEHIRAIATLAKGFEPRRTMQKVARY